MVMRITPVEGLTTLQSAFGPQETMNGLEAQIKAHGMSVFARINHAALAAEAGLSLRPTEVIIFGNPRGGTPLMQANQTMGIELPLKALVWQDELGKTWLSYNEPDWLAKRHGVVAAERVLATMSLALNDMAAKATREMLHEGTPNKPVSTATNTKGTAADLTGAGAKGETRRINETGEPPQTPQKPSAALPRVSLILRFIAIGAVITGIAGLFAYVGGWLTPHALTPAQITDTFQLVNGLHPGFRRNHAKGVCVSGYFNSNGQGATLSKASLFQPGRVPIIGRFSLAGGQPFAADAPHTVRGLGIRFKPRDGEEWRTAMINLPVFTVRTPQAFNDQLLALAPDPATGKPDPARMQAFLAKYPESAKAMQVIRTHPMSSGFENSSFNSLNAFRFINAAGAVTWVRWSMVPVQPFEPIGTTDSGQADKNQLFDALIASVHRHPLEWHLIITIAQPGDPTDDATLPWPPNREQVDVGTLTIDHVESDDTSPARDINFDPLVLPNGMATSDDPLLSARSAVYSRSFTRREGEHKHPGAVSTAETEK
jgi:catalase